MNRHLARTLAMQTLYEWDFQPSKSIDELLTLNLRSADREASDTTFLKELIHGVILKVDNLDELISKSAPEWPMDQVSIVDKTILRLAIYEILYREDVPAKVAINEAVELAKTFGGDNTSKFVNGVLGTIYRQSDRYKKDKVEGDNDKPATN